MMIQVGIVEDKKELRESLATNILLYDNLRISFLAPNGQLAVDKCAIHRPDVVLMDIEMPVMNGIEATKKIKKENPEIKVLMLTVFDDDEQIMKAIFAGASGYLLKEEHPSKIIEAITELHSGGAAMNPAIALKTLNLLRNNNSTQITEHSELGITERELQVLNRLAKGLDYKAISVSLGISPKTVRNHIQKIYTKLHVSNKTAALNKARSNGWI